MAPWPDVQDFLAEVWIRESNSEGSPLGGLLDWMKRQNRSPWSEMADSLSDGTDPTIEVSLRPAPHTHPDAALNFVVHCSLEVNLASPFHFEDATRSRVYQSESDSRINHGTQDQGDLVEL